MQQEQSIFHIYYIKIRLFVQRLCIGIIKGYRYIISPLLPPSCRFTPTCSRYAIEAIETHGPLKGIFLALGRILRCHPFCKGGYDPVPSVKKESCTGCDESSEKEQTDNTTGCRIQTGSVIL